MPWRVPVQGSAFNPANGEFPGRSSLPMAMVPGLARGIRLFSSTLVASLLPASPPPRQVTLLTGVISEPASTAVAEPDAAAMGKLLADVLCGLGVRCRTGAR